jgi:hypothetical protein
MNPAGERLRGGGLALEAGIVLLLAWALLTAIPLAHGDLGISWDMLNHHIYLGWSAEAPRFERDVLPAAYQTYQFPYLYWPVYKLAAGGFSGVQAGFVLGTLQLLNVPPLWIIARQCIAETGWFGAAMRVLAVLLALLSCLVLSLLDATSNDLLSAAPVLWAFAIALGPAIDGAAPRQARRRAVLAGLLGGLGVACKLSNGPLVLLLAVPWLLVPGSARDRLLVAFLGGVALVVGFAASYAFWGWQLWTHFGNPFFPMFDGWFGPVRAAVGWQP